MKFLFIAIVVISTFYATPQSYTNFLTGSATDIVTVPGGGTCMMGGASEHDEAMKWFLERANYVCSRNFAYQTYWCLSH